MAVSIGCGLSRTVDTREAAAEAAAEAARQLGDAPADLCVVFASGSHLAAPETALEVIHELLSPASLIGCGAAGVLSGPHEIEDATALTVWAASIPDGEVTTFHADTVETEDGYAIAGMIDLAGASAAILLPDPYSFPTDSLLLELARAAPAVPIVGGLSSARTFDATAALFHDEVVHESGAVGARLDGVEILPCVSQGATPLGPELTITAAEGHVIHELAGENALEKLREVFAALAPSERDLIGDGLLVGLVIDSGKPEYGFGDFLVRGLLGADPEAGSIAVGANVAIGQVLQLHARDAAIADRDLRSSLSLRRTALGEQEPAGALVFTCNGRGEAMFGTPSHDATALQEQFAGAPAAGFFAAGEIGPVGGESFLHGFTATIALFAP